MKKWMWLLAFATMLVVGCKEKKGVEKNDIPNFFDNKAAEQAARRQSSANNDIDDAANTSFESKGKDTKVAKPASWPRKMEVPAPMENAGDELLLSREGYRVSYNVSRRVPNWVAWHLTASHTNGDFRRDDITFSEDMEVPGPRATDDDYYSSRYDRGHLCPSGDCKWSKTAQRQSFLFTNVCPQNHELNKGDWNDLEMQCRKWARDYGDIYVVAGPIFYGGVKNTIGKNRVAVPDAFFKVVLDDGRKAKAIGFIYPNKSGHNDMTFYVKSIDEVERITGIDFFPMLDDNVEDRVEAADRQSMIRDWRVDKAVTYFNNLNRQ